MKSIRIAYLAVALLAIDAFAQPSPTAPPSQVPPLRMPPNGAKMAQQPSMPATPPVMPPKDRLSYVLGANIASTIKKDDLDIDVDLFAQGMRDTLTSTNSKYTEAEIKSTMTAFQGALRAKMQAEREKQMKEAQAKGEENKAKGAEYMAANGKKPGVITLTNGLQYKVITEGSGPMPKPNDTVTVAYKGSLINGVTFDQNTNFTTPVTGRTIKGWSEILPLMKTGSKWEVTIPGDLAYGPRGNQKIGPNEVLIFDMELISVTPGPAVPAPGSGPKPVSMNPKPAPMPLSSNMPPPPGGSMNVVSGQIIKVPSKADMDKGAKIEVITNASNQ